MNLLERVTVVGRPYVINIVDAPKDNGQICWGTTDYGKGLIEICSSLNETAKKANVNPRINPRYDVGNGPVRKL